MLEMDKLGVNDKKGYDGENQSGDQDQGQSNNGNHFCSLRENSRNEIERACDLLVAVSACAELNKAKIIELAFSASEELRVMAEERAEPLWIFDIDKGSEALNVAEYKRRFSSLDPALEVIVRVIKKGEPSDLLNLDQRFECQSENGCMSSYTAENMDSQGSRAKGFVFKDPISLVNMFMDVDKWSSTFFNIVSKAKNLAVLSTGNQGSPNGCIQVMVAEFHIPSPLVKTREIYFVRYSRQIDNDTWVVADVSLETILPNPVLTCQRRPSGCVIQTFQDGLSMVTWVEHSAECIGVVHSMLKKLLTSGLAFSAKRWISTLERQCDRISTLEAQNDSDNKGLRAAKNGLLTLAERMVRRFNSNICSNMESAWTPLPLPGAEEILIKTSFNPDHPHITIATSVWLPVKQNCVFTFLQNEQNRNKWDVLSDGLKIQDIIRVSSARNCTDCVSVVSVEPYLTRTAITYLQESFSDSIAYYVGYAPVDLPTMHHILQGGSADSVAILPSGFAVLPDGLLSENSILTVAFQIIDEQLTTPQELPPLSVLTAYRLMEETISRIRLALLPKS